MGKPLPNTPITVKGIDRQSIRIALTDEKGVFTMIRMVPGQYKLSIPSFDLPFGKSAGGNRSPSTCTVGIAEGEKTVTKFYTR